MLSANLDRLSLRVLEELESGQKRSRHLAETIFDLEGRKFATFWRAIRYRLEKLEQLGYVVNGQSIRAKTMTMTFWRLTEQGKELSL